MSPDGLSNIWDNGIAIGVIIIFAYFTWLNIKSSSDREERLFRSNENLTRVIDEHASLLKRHNEILEQQGKLIQKQFIIIENMAKQVSDVSDVIRYLKIEVSTLRENVSEVCDK